MVESVEGVGTTFSMYLPTTVEGMKPGFGGSTLVLRELGDQTVLVVEDEQFVRQLTSEVLRTRGYRVLEAPNGEKALRVASEHAEQIHLLVTDVVMPRMRGPELARKMSVLRSDLKVLYMSGYTDAGGTQVTLDPDTPFLQKPFTPTALMNKVQEVLENPVGHVS